MTTEEMILLSEELKHINHKMIRWPKNCVDTIVFYLSRGKWNKACACTMNEWDKIESEPILAKWLITKGLFKPFESIKE